MKFNNNMVIKYLSRKFLFISTLALYCTLLSCASQTETIKMGVFSDAHFLSPKLMDGGSAIQKYDETSGKTVMQVPQVLDQVLKAYEDSDIEVLLIPGDMTKDSEKQSHLDFVEKLNPLIDKGVRVFVIPGNHDVNRPNSVGYRGDETYKVDNVNAEEFSQIYADCGYRDAIKRDRNSLSYVAELNPSTWLLAIDCQEYEEYSPTYVTSAGRVKPETEKWIVEIAEEAKKNNIQLIGMMHHNLLEHIPMQSTFFSEYIVDDWQRLRDLFANLGMKVIFTGHFHVNDIAHHLDDKLHKIHDVATGSLVAYSYPYRFVEFDNKEMKITTQNIISTPDAPNLLSDNKLFMQERIRNVALGIIDKRKMDIDPKTKNMLVDIVSKIFIKRMAGDETMDDDLVSSIQKLSAELGVPIDLDTIMQEENKFSDNNDTIILF